jgi:hypothetical protein
VNALHSVGLYGPCGTVGRSTGGSSSAGGSLNAPDPRGGYGVPPEGR